MKQKYKLSPQNAKVDEVQIGNDGDCGILQLARIEKLHISADKQIRLTEVKLSSGGLY